MNIGNTWYYRFGATDSLVYEITQTIVMDQRLYYEMVRLNMTNNTESKVYYRMEGSVLYERDMGYDERIIADFSLSEGTGMNVVIFHSVVKRRMKSCLQDRFLPTGVQLPCISVMSG